MLQKVHSGQAITECHRPDGLYYRNLFLMVLEARMSKTQATADLVSGDNLLLVVASDCLFMGPPSQEGEKSLLLQFILQRSESHHEAPPLWTSSASERSHLLISIYFGFQSRNYRRHLKQNSVHNSLPIPRQIHVLLVCNLHLSYPSSP